MAVWEAASTGVPIVSTDVGDVADVLNGLVSIVAPENPRELAAAILETLDASPGHVPALRRRISEYASLPQIVSLHEKVYRNLATLKGANAGIGR